MACMGSDVNCRSTGIRTTPPPTPQIAPMPPATRPAGIAKVSGTAALLRCADENFLACCFRALCCNVVRGTLHNGPWHATREVLRQSWPATCAGLPAATGSESTRDTTCRHDTNRFAPTFIACELAALPVHARRSAELAAPCRSNAHLSIAYLQMQLAPQAAGSARQCSARMPEGACVVPFRPLSRIAYLIVCVRVCSGDRWPDCRCHRV